MAIKSRKRAFIIPAVFVLFVLAIVILTIVTFQNQLAEAAHGKVVTPTSYDQIFKGFLTRIILLGLLGLLIVITVEIYQARSMTGPLRHIIEGLAGGATQVASAAVQVSQASQQMAQGASEQASSIEETSSSLEEIASMTKQNASNSDEAVGLMSEAESNINKGKELMKLQHAAMEEIKRSSDASSKVVKTIDEIAFQTNLLALNSG